MKFRHLILIPVILSLTFLAACASDEEEPATEENVNHQEDSGGNDGSSGNSGSSEESGNNGGGQSDGDASDSQGDGTDSGTETSDNDTTPGEQNDDGDQTYNECTPKAVEKCHYQGKDGTEGVGPCKAGSRTCQNNGKWGSCSGEVIPVPESGNLLCSDGIDNDCNGVVDDGTDFDQDGHGACSDCCETIDDCPNPAEAWDETKDVCEYGNPGDHKCDSNLNPDSHDPSDYAKAIGVCKTTTEDSDEWGLISARIVAPSGKESGKVHDGSHGLLSGLGKVISPKGKYMLALTTGQVANPFSAEGRYNGGTSSEPPKDWFNFHDEKFPSAPACSNGKESEEYQVNDAVMCEMKIKVPADAKSFSMKIYFLTKEYPLWLCQQYNDFFIALLDSEYKSSDSTLKNPDDKNLAMDKDGNPVGVNLAPAGLFTQCENNEQVSSCKGTEELKGTGFESNGGTGWLTTRGNVVGGEIITLRLAIWDLYDHVWDSLVLIDNFRWDTNEYTPGTSL